jgi:hypothetical protein
MEESKNNIYKQECKSLNGKIEQLRKEVSRQIKANQKQQELLEELYELIYYKRAWLTLCDDNIIGMQKVVARLPAEEMRHGMPKTSAECEAEKTAEENIND